MAVYHRGSRVVQERAGVVELADRIGRSVRAVIPDVAADFLTEQHLVVVAAVADDDRVWCSALTGPRGFLQAVDDRTLGISATPSPGDPLTTAQDGAEVGTIVLDPTSRRRMRLNGRLRRLGNQLLVEADEVVSNCPKYITERRVVRPPNGGEAATRTIVTDAVTPAQVAVLRDADTFFLATSGGTEGGLDASHRGGNPGFLHVDDRTVSWPDYAGNAMFLSLGNLEVDPRAGILVLDWEGGGTLQLSGRARLEWFGSDERRVVLDVEQVRAHEGATDGRWALVELSRFNPPGHGPR